jgi:CubicO group peptidase (beta-lactamase class C family)
MNNELPRSAPEAQGIASTAILNFIEAVDTEINHLHSFMMLRHGQVVAEGWWAPYGPEFQHMLFSLSKSFASTAVGLAVAEGHFTVDDPVLPFFPEEAPAEVSDNLAAMRIRHLLSMSTGHAGDTTGHLRQAEDGNWARAFLAQPVEYEPGTHFLYNSGATYMLSALVQKVTGQTLVEYLQPRLFEPLGIKDPSWQTCPRGINTGGWGLNLKTEDIARFGQLYLQNGVWQGQQIVPADWVAEATAYQVSNSSNDNIDWQQGYAYQFWRCQHNAYRGDGAFGQYCVVMPDQDAVLAITSGLQNMQAVLDLVWKHLLPALQAEPLPENKSAEAALSEKLAGLALHPVFSGIPSPMADKISGRCYQFEPNEAGLQSVTFDFGSGESQVIVRDERGEHLIRCGSGDWLTGVTTFDPMDPKRRYAASGAWTAPDTYTAEFYLYETPFCVTVTARFEGDKVYFDQAHNVAFGSKEQPQCLGQAV